MKIADITSNEPLMRACLRGIFGSSELRDAVALRGSVLLRVGLGVRVEVSDIDLVVLGWRSDPAAEERQRVVAAVRRATRGVRPAGMDVRVPLPTVELCPAFLPVEAAWYEHPGCGRFRGLSVADQVAELLLVAAVRPDRRRAKLGEVWEVMRRHRVGVEQVAERVGVKLPNHPGREGLDVGRVMRPVVAGEWGMAGANVAVGGSGMMV